MSVIFNSVDTYVKSVGQHRSIRKWNTLDSLECIWTGPTKEVEHWIPKVGQRHPQYPSMTMEGADVVDEAAGVTTLRVTYIGKYYGVGHVAVGQSIQWGESSYVQYYGMYSTYHQGKPAVPAVLDEFGDVQTPATPAEPDTFTYEFVSYNWASRYAIATVTYKALAKSIISLGGGGGGVLNRYDYRTGRISASTGMGLVNSTLTFPNQLIDQQANSLNNGWYELSETWGPRAVVDSAVFDIKTDNSTSFFGVLF